MAGNRVLSSRGAASQIEAFLWSDTTAPLTVAVGFASVRGLAWLAKRTADRPVTLVIGDCRQMRFAKASAADRQIAQSFLARDDVTIKNWYRKNPEPAEAHLKVWIAHTEKGPAALVGSANLTGAGLFRNQEMVTAPAPSDLPRVVDEVEALVDQAFDAKTRLTEYIRSDRTRHRPEQDRRPDRRRAASSERAAPKGYLVDTDRPSAAVGAPAAVRMAPKGCRPPAMIVGDAPQAVSPERAAPKGCLSVLLRLIGAAALLATAFVMLERVIFGQM